MIFCFGTLWFKNFLSVAEKLVIAQNSKSQMLKSQKNNNPQKQSKPKQTNTQNH